MNSSKETVLKLYAEACADKKNSKETVLKFYAEACEKALPGKGQAAVAIVEKYWNADAQELADAYASIAPMQVLKEIAGKNPAMAAEIKALKG